MLIHYKCRHSHTHTVQEPELGFVSKEDEEVDEVHQLTKEKLKKFEKKQRQMKIAKSSKGINKDSDQTSRTTKVSEMISSGKKTPQLTKKMTNFSRATRSQKALMW